MSLESLISQPLRVINIGIDVFALELQAAGVPVVHVAWQPPAGGDPRLAALLASLDEDEPAQASGG